ncbi:MULTISPECIES: flagellar basal body-associated protein FliL [unclassified Undibacterium]|uniref:flagellar basal body-associated protein FliL n=1 Tax=unclassified Undibacterium TaxID=2630295 RepID=UPI002AC930FF|nr:MULTISPECIES: flagellar basal body-associated protein FliL [unclassified Undibacterium]MEB0139861.1 flagellar basal body-associated protein FliL [Undibacterium sp. CCC2.1]MEB0172791.1 flagellar basal body-associated protein FliL [Undibacterium sp. CCC1.1]MEB0176583.1 flagellar basal body-associated protein FliL [Undibacterium sp. CCC3.4]MEB0215827.1 flagellar basal body-associated protein FliL [Undibacterium sp. 5I2]WPX42678.1 flagellar basal body-associated protein FliL [Undibacterium sp. 
MAKKPAKAAPEHAEAAPAGKSKKKLIIIILAAVLLLAGLGGGAVFFLSKKNAGAKEKEHKTEVAKPAVFLPLEPFTVNLQSDGNDKYLQITMTVEVEGEEQVNVIKANMPQVRSRLLLLLSSKDASEIISNEGKDKLVEEIMEKISQPFTAKGEPQKVSGVYFTSFIVQ